jgi:hypothetical protein
MGLELSCKRLKVHSKPYQHYLSVDQYNTTIISDLSVSIIV